MVIKYDDIQPHLDEFEVIDKRDSGNSGGNNGSNSGGNSGSASPQGGQEQMPDEAMSGGPSLSEREKIYQRGPDGLREIKKNRLKNWLSNSEGVGAQTEQRILMVFDRNESVHRNPHVLYNLLDDEVGASASYLNTMVQDIFSPEEEHSDLLNSQGYTPWFNRGGNTQNMQQNMGQGGPMNATGASQFSPGNQQGGQQQYNQQQQNNQHPNQQNQQQQQQQQQSDMSSDSVSREEAEMMMQQAVNQASQQQERNALLSGLSDATDEALREMAGNVGGLAGTVQRVIDEALVEYARENPEWVIDNMDILQKVMGATKDADSDGNQKQAAEEDKKVDSALDNITSGGPQQTPNNQQNQQSMQQRQPQSQPQQQQTQQQNNPTPEPRSTQTEEPSDQPRNPDLDDDLMGESGFEHTPDTRNFDADESDEVVEDTEPEPEPEVEADSASDDSSEGFDEIFGDMAED